LVAMKQSIKKSPSGPRPAKSSFRAFAATHDKALIPDTTSTT
jgi:hypothetical protein